MTPAEMLKAQRRDEKAEVTNLMRRLTRRANGGDRLKIFGRLCDWQVHGGDSSLKSTLITLRIAADTNDTPAYVRAWCILNKLKA